MRSFSFEAKSQCFVDIGSLAANVRIEGRPGSRTVDIRIEGDERLVEKFEVNESHPGDLRLTYGTPPPTVLVGSDGSTGHVSHRGGGVNILCDVISGGDITISNVVISGGAVISQQSGEVIRVDRVPEVVIAVPEGTILDVQAGGSGTLAIAGVKERLRLAVRGDRAATVSDALHPQIEMSGSSRLRLDAAGDVFIRCSGSSKCGAVASRTEIGRAIDVRVVASGSSRVKLRGGFGKALFESSGSSEIAQDGPCDEIEARASGSSEIDLENAGSPKIHQRRTSGSARISGI